MADDRKQDGEPALEFSWDPLELAADQTYSTTLRIKLTGWWEGGRPRQVAAAVYKRGEEPPSGNAVRIQKGCGTFPLTGLLPGHHYLVVVYIGDRLPVHKMIPVPELPKPEKPKTPKNLLVSFSGPDGNQRFLITVSDENGVLISNQSVIVTDGSQTVCLKTNENGYVLYEANFTESDRYFEIRAGNSHELIWRARILGPTRPVQSGLPL